ncbi:MAG: hypothetical protein P8Y24_06405 [Gammaproteobacteria bacterium]
MFEHKHLDGEVNKVIAATDSFLNGDVLECRDSLGEDAQSISRRQYAVVGDRLVERCLPPETVGDTWSFDDVAMPWWGSVKNPPHMGIIAEFNSFNNGLHRKPIDLENNVVAYGAEGEEVTFCNGSYSMTRRSDEQELTAPTLVALRKLYYA